MPQRWNQDQLNIISDFFSDSHEDFGGRGNRPKFSGWAAFDWSDLLARINALGPVRSQGSLAAKWQNLASVHLEQAGRKPESSFSKQDIATYENARQRYEHRLKG